MPAKYTPEERIEAFWSKVDKSGGQDSCWTWTANTDRYGYGKVKWLGKMCLAHRIAYLLTKGDIGKLCVLHKCDNPPCVNPNHLWLGTNEDNVQDRDKKGRHTPCCGEDHGRCKLTDRQVQEIRARYTAGGVMQKSLANEYGVSKAQISKIVRKELRTKGANHA